MSKVIYLATKDNRFSVLRQIPCQSTARKLDWPVYKLIERNGRWEFISEWWYPTVPSLLPYPMSTAKLSFERAIELNRYITNGVSTRTGEYKAVQMTNLSAEVFHQRYLDIQESGARNLLQKAISNAVRLRRDQVFYDGNHRTAILLLYETLAEHGYLLQAKPLTLYIHLSNRTPSSIPREWSWDGVEGAMFQHCKSRLKLDYEPRSEDNPALFANAVKSLDVVNSFLNQWAQMWYSAEGKGNPQLRELVQYLKQADRDLYQQFHRLCVKGGWECIS
jgi:prophage maintenance system killer protein